jgi:hypothetical protein
MCYKSPIVRTVKSKRLTRAIQNEVEEARDGSLKFCKRKPLVNVHLENIEGDGRIRLRLIGGSQFVRATGGWK